MKTLFALVLLFSLTPAFPQHRGGGGGMRGGGGGFRSGVGSGGFRSGITGGGFHRGFGTPGVRSGGYFGYRGPAIRGYYGGFRHRYSYPLYLGGFGWGWGWGWPGYGYSSYFPAYSEYTAPAPATYLGDPYRSENMGPVIVNNLYEPERSRPPDVRIYPDWQSTEPTLYLIARTDDSVIAAIAYWVEGDTLHYVDRRHEQKQIRLDQVDRALSEQLNRERRVDFRLPR